MPSLFAGSPEFQRLLQGEASCDLVTVALEIARDAFPDLDPRRYLERIDTLAGRIRDRCPPGTRPRQVLGQINWVLFVEESFQGNGEDYYDPNNSYLNQVIDRRTGIPISLSILYAALAGRVGLSLAGVNLPAHFMLRLEHGEPPIFVDPFHSGALLDRKGCQRTIARLVGEPVELSDVQLAPCGPDLVVGRLLRNLKGIYLRSHDYMAALPVQRRLAALNQGDAREQRDLGMLCLQVDRPGEAIVPLEAYLEARPESDYAAPVRALLRAARREVAAWN